MRRQALLFLTYSALVWGCGAHSPAGPSGSGTATINGAIVAPGSGSLSAAAAAASSTTVSVAGTTLSTQVDGSNRFALRDVPTGDVQLQFSGPGVNAALGLSAVQSSELIAIGVSVSPTSAVLEASARSMGSEAQLEGRVESLPPTTLPGTFVVAGRVVTTNSSTQFFRGGTPVTFSALEIGFRVHVKGQGSGTSLLASVVEIQNTNADIPVEINGVVTDFTGTSANFQFKIDGRLIKGDALTEFFGNSAFSNLANGARAEVKGSQRDGFVYATRIHVNVDEGDQDDSASIEGPLLTKSGAFPNFILIIGGTPNTTVRTSSSTEVQRRGDVQGLNVLALGMTLHVVGVRQSDGSLNARMIQIKDDATGGLLEIEGSLGGLHGTCPALTFGVNGYSIFTDAGTVFTPACSTFKSGNKVKVKGVVQAGGSVKATSVEKQ